MKKGILLVIGLSFNLMSFAANDLTLGQTVLLGAILETFVQRNNLPITIPQPIRTRDVREQRQERYKTLKRNQPQHQRFHKRQQ